LDFGVGVFSLSHTCKTPGDASGKPSKGAKNPWEICGGGVFLVDNHFGLYVLEVETRGPFKGPRAYDATGLPLHFDNESTFKERIFIDKNDPNILHDVITVIDHALTRPWTVDKTYRRGTNKYPNWSRISCLEGTSYVTIGKEFYLLSWDGYLMPLTKGQQPPDTRYFPKKQK
jgi:hypothetical protein